MACNVYSPQDSSLILTYVDNLNTQFEKLTLLIKNNDLNIESIDTLFKPIDVVSSLNAKATAEIKDIIANRK